MSLEMGLENMDLTPKQMAKVKACQSLEGLYELGKKEGHEPSVAILEEARCPISSCS